MTLGQHTLTAMTSQASLALMKFLADLARQLGVGKHVYVVGGAVRNSRKGTERPPEVVAKTAAKNRGQKRTPEQKVRMRQARLVYLARKQETA